MKFCLENFIISLISDSLKKFLVLAKSTLYWSYIKILSKESYFRVQEILIPETFDSSLVPASRLYCHEDLQRCKGDKHESDNEFPWESI